MELSANTQYQYTSQMQGGAGGDTPWQPSFGPLPHPIWTTNDGLDTIVELNAVTLGGFNGLNS